MSENYYDRTVMLIGAEAFERLRAASVMVVGLGGVGSWAAEALVRAGIGHITLADYDDVAVTNINRQLIADTSTLGMNKAEAALRRARTVRPDIDARAIKLRLSAETVGDYFSVHYDYVLDAIDDVPAKVLLAKECAARDIPLAASMGTGGKLDPTAFYITDIYKTSMDPLARKLRRLYREAGIEKLDVICSREKPVAVTVPPASISFVPPSAGLILAGHIIRNIAGLTPGITQQSI